MCPADERKEMEEKPVGERPRDVRSRPEVIMERDAKHLSDEIPGTTTGIGDDEPPGGAVLPSAPASGEGRIRATTPDGKPYADDQDPDGRYDGVSNTGSGSLP
jgi:hypothetical protein